MSILLPRLRHSVLSVRDQKYGPSISQQRSLHSNKFKTRCIYFRILVLGGPSPPSQLVPNPFNWSPKSVFYRYLSNGHSNPKNSKNEVHLFSNFGSRRTLPTQSTGPQPSQLVPKFIECALDSQNHQIGPNKPIIISYVESIQHFQLVPNPFNWSQTQSTGPQSLNKCFSLTKSPN